MRKVFIIEGIRGVVVNVPKGAYYEEAKIGRYVVRAILLVDGGYAFHVFKGDELKAIISNEEWFISRIDGECQNLLNRLLTIYG